MDTVNVILKILFGTFFVGAGLNHFLMTDFYLRMMPLYLPWHTELVYLSGVAEVILGVLLLIPATTTLAGWGLMALLIAVFPANLHMAMHASEFSEFPVIGLWVRLPLQSVLIAWAYRYTRPSKMGYVAPR